MTWYNNWQFGSRWDRSVSCFVLGLGFLRRSGFGSVLGFELPCLRGGALIDCAYGVSVVKDTLGSLSCHAPN